MKNKSLVFVAFAVLVSASCSMSLDPGFYRVEGEEVSGILQVKDDHSAVLYPNENLLIVRPVAVTPRKRSLQLEDGREMKVSVNKYRAPEFRILTGKSLYRKAKYEVQVDTDVVYGRARGYWTSYPDRDESIGRTYLRKYFDLLSGSFKRVFLPWKKLDLTMDIYTPKDHSSKPRPLLLLIHGGAFFNGDKADADSALIRWAGHFASLGYVVSSINYRLGFSDMTEGEIAGYRALQDANAAIRYLLQDPLLNIDPGLIFVVGESSGAITALNLAYMTSDYRPKSTEGLFFGLIGNEGEVDMISPPAKQTFRIRAVGNLWGAVSDTMMLQNTNLRVPVISFHSEDDKTVPFGSAYPFEPYSSVYRVVREVGESVVNAMYYNVYDLLEYINLQDFLRTEMHGSSVINRVLRRKGIRSELHSFPGDRHRLHLRDMKIDEENFTLIQNEMEAFFSSEMVADPVSIAQDPQDKQRFYISPESSNVKKCYWKVEGGFIVDKNFDSVRIILKPDDAVHSLTVSGIYKDSGISFTETYVIE